MVKAGPENLGLYLYLERVKEKINAEDEQPELPNIIITKKLKTRNNIEDKVEKVSSIM